jgi:hypothetical protein
MDVQTLATVANLLSVARRCTRAQAGTVYRRKAEGLVFLVAQNDTLAQSVGHAASADLLTRFPLRWTEPSVAMYVALTGMTLDIPDAYAIPADRPYSFDPRIDARSGFRTVSMLVVPLRSPIDGVLQLINATNDHGDIVPFSCGAELAVRELVSLESEALPRLDAPA